MLGDAGAAFGLVEDFDQDFLWWVWVVWDFEEDGALFAGGSGGGGGGGRRG